MDYFSNCVKKNSTALSCFLSTSLMKVKSIKSLGRVGAGYFFAWVGVTRNDSKETESGYHCDVAFIINGSTSEGPDARRLNW